MRSYALPVTLIMACGAAADSSPDRLPPLECEVADAARPLPSEVHETSGLARSARDPHLLWTHNDAGHGAYLFGVAADGRLVSRVRVTGAGLVDWEDMETAPCGADECLYIADTGDNAGDRAHVTIYRVREPGAGATEAAAEALHARYPDGSRDAEALFAHGDELYLVTKGRHREVALYRWPAAQHAGSSTVLEPVRVLFPRPADSGDRVTGASASPDGRWIGIRTYRTLYLFAADELVAGASAVPYSFDLSRLGEPQGEGLLLLNDGTVWLSSEAESRSKQPRLARLRCTLPG